VPVNVPTLDDRSYADLVREGLELIPGSAPEWTNHNASDPGITLVELFAYLAEIYLYRIDRVSAANKAKFLKLLTEVDRRTADDRQLHAAVVAMRVPSRAISEADFEFLAMNAVEQKGHSASVSRVHCFARRNFEAAPAAERQRDRPGHTSVVFVPVDPRLSETALAAIAQAIRNTLEPRRLLTSRVHVVSPRYVDVAIRIRAAIVASRASIMEAKIRQDVEEQYRSWPLGRGVYTSDLYRRLATIHGVLRVLGIEWTTDDATRLLRSETGDVVGVHLDAGELPRVTVSGVVCEAHS
jgi:hypothetical protein